MNRTIRAIAVTLEVFGILVIIAGIIAVIAGNWFCILYIAVVTLIIYHSVKERKKDIEEEKQNKRFIKSIKPDDHVSR